MRQKTAAIAIRSLDDIAVGETATFDEMVASGVHVGLGYCPNCPCENCRLRIAESFRLNSDGTVRKLRFRPVDAKAAVGDYIRIS